MRLRGTLISNLSKIDFTTAADQAGKTSETTAAAVAVMRSSELYIRIANNC